MVLFGYPQHIFWLRNKKIIFFAYAVLSKRAVQAQFLVSLTVITSYPSGNLAILITSVKLGQYHYTIHQDVKRAGVAAAFEPSGYGYCYYPNGDVR